VNRERLTKGHQMNDTSRVAGSTVGPTPCGTIDAAHRRRADRSRLVVPTAVAIVTIISGLILPSALPPAAVAAVPAAESTLDPALVAQLEAALDKGFADSGMPGVTVGLWIPGQGEWVATRGVSNINTNEPMNRANQAKIGSITKTLVGMTALQIIGEGQVGLTLDNTIDRWYPDFPEASSITIRMLLNMSSGIAEWDPGQIDMICTDPHHVIAPDEVIAIGATLPRKPFAPGQGFQYSGINTFILGRILEKVTGTDLTTLLTTRLLTPLGMTRSRFAPDGVLTPPLTHGYTDFCPAIGTSVDATDWTMHEAWAAGAMLSTIDDLHTWGVALGAGVGLTPELRAARVDDIAPGGGYGLGVGVRLDPTTGCVLDLNHAGAEPGYGAYVASFTTTGSVFTLIGNGDGGTGQASFAVLRALAPVMLPVVDHAPTTSCANDPTPVVTAPVAAAPVVTKPAFTG
jgi:D-alanyl-D-alanine carboxypeptidase